MEFGNLTTITEFLLLGFTNRREFQILLFLLFFLLYLSTLLGNLGIIFLVHTDGHLHTPMYYLLSNLSFLDLCYSSSVTPKTMSNLLAERKTISFLGCAMQLFSFAVFCTTEVYILAVMAFDRYIAICLPLLYPTIMKKSFCIQLVICSYLVSFLQSLIVTMCIFQLEFCRSNFINHFFCDVPPLLNLSCSDATFIEILIYTLGGFAEGTSLFVITISYVCILSAILKIPTLEGRQKTFSTCASHFTVVTLFYGTVIFVYFRPSSYSQAQERAVSVIYTMVIPMLNPLIYSLRNKDVKQALRKAVQQ
ncbi:olfactory receptor 5I1-like [Ambystoma mexicanum]|uniref:olfactory receptor 5I1-like n=1 Tax=Ambystoma mexicanum TaxID=8296 RepID=UPI0037E83A29